MFNLPPIVEHLFVEIIAATTMEQGSKFVSSLYGHVARGLRNLFAGKPDVDAVELIRNLGELHSHQIETLIDDWSERAGRELSEEQQQDLERLMLSLSQGAHTLSTQGISSSKVLLSTEMLERMLIDMRPVRCRGEAVSPSVPWKLRSFLGRGAHGEVWTAEHPSEDAKLVQAFKFFTAPESQHILRDEANILTRIMNELSGQHPGIVNLLDFDQRTDNGAHPYIRFEYVPGGSLERWILQDASRRPKLVVFELIEKITDAVATAHEKQIYHRDLKPANILLTSETRPVPKLTDFGLATIQHSVTASVSQVHSQTMVAGTQMYLPPESQQALAEHDWAQQDVFALGVIWYQLLVGRLERPPYDFAEELRGTGVDAGTIRLISRCLAHPGRRFADAVALREALDSAPEFDWTPDEGQFDVAPLVREYLSETVHTSPT